MTRFSPRHAADPYRYGVYLRPDPRTCAAVTTITTHLRAQFGLISAGAFPPHATLAGSEPLGRDEDAIIDAITKPLTGRPAFPVRNLGPVRRDGIVGGTPKAGIGYDIDQLEHGEKNLPFFELAAAVSDAVAPLRLPMDDPEPNYFDPETFNAHLSLASHDMFERPELIEEVQEYIDGLDIPYPRTFTGEWVALYRTRSDDWTGRWWHTLTWEHVHSWRLAPTAD